MTDSQNSVSLWIQQARDGDREALAHLHQRYWPVLVGMARNRLPHSTDVADEEDVAAAAFFDFYDALSQQRLPDVRNRHHFLALLSHIVACKACNQIKHERAQRRGGGQVQRSSPLVALVEDESYSPLQKMLLKESYEKYLSNLPPGVRPCAELMLQGYTHREIARSLGCVERTVERKAAIIRDTWKELAAASLSQSVSSML